MSARGYGSAASEGRSIQAPGMMRHGPAPSLGPPLHHPIDPPLPPPELLEKNLAIQGAEMDKLFRENHKLAATHGALRHELLAAQQEMQRVQAHAAEVQTDSSLKIRGLLDKISKMEADVKAGELVEKELQQAHLEAQGLVSARMDLSNQIQLASSELQRMRSDIKKLPELHSEIERFMQEHQKLRSTFEREKGANMELVQKMHAMEKNLISMAREVEKLRSETQEAEKRAQVPTPNPYQSPYGAAEPSRNPGQDVAYNQGVAYSQGGSYTSGLYGQYANGGYAQASQAGYSDPYGRAAQAQMMSNMTGEKANPYGSSAGEKVNPYGSSVATATYNSAQGASVSAYDSAGAAAASYGGTGGYDNARAAAAAAAAGGAYDPPRGAAAYEASRIAAAGGNAPGMRDATRPGEGGSGSYNAAMGAGNVYGMYDAARAAQMPMQR